MSSNKSFNTMWAGMDEKIHTPKLTWSIGKTGFESDDKFLEMEKSKNNIINKIHDPDLTISSNYIWLILHLFLKQMHNR